MNALIKVIITTILGFIGTMDIGDKIPEHTIVDHIPVIELPGMKSNPGVIHQFNLLSCKKLKNNISC